MDLESILLDTLSHERRQQWRKAQRNNDRSAEAGWMCSAGDLLRYRMKAEPALCCYAAALQIYNELDDLAGQSKAHTGIAQVHDSQEQADYARYHHSRAVELSIEADDCEAEIAARTVYSWYCRNRKDFDSTIAHYRAIRQCAARLDNPRHAYNVLRQIITLYAERKDYAGMLPHLHDMLQVAHAIDPDNMIGTEIEYLHELTVALLQLGRLDEATYYAEQASHRAATIASTSPDRHAEIKAMVGITIGDVERTRKDYDRAIEHYKIALHNAQRTDDLHWHTAAVLRLAETSHERGNYQQSLKWYTDATRIMNFDDDFHTTIPGIFENMAEICVQYGNYLAATSYYQQAISTFSMIQQHHDINRIRYTLARHILKHFNNVQAARELMSICVNSAIDDHDPAMDTYITYLETLNTMDTG